MKRTLFAVFAILVIASMALTACGPKPATGTITLWHAWKDNEIASLNEVIAAFQAENPDVTFDILYVPFDDLRGKFETAAGTGGGPSVLIGAADWGPAMYDAGLLADLTDLADDKFLGTINEAALGAVQYNDVLIGLPETIKGVVMFRNKTIVPEAPTSFDDLVAKAQAATAGDVYGAYMEYGFFFSIAHIYGVGGTLMDSAGDPTFNDAKGVEFLEMIKRFAEAGPMCYYADDDVNLFKAGKAGIIIDGTWNTASLAEAIGAENLAIDPWPTGLSGFVQTENIYLNANATGDDQNAAWQFMKFFMSEEAQSLLADPTKAGHIPATKGVEVSDPLLQQAATAFEGGAVFPVIPEMGAYWGPGDTLLKSVVDEGVDPATALQTAFDAIVDAIAVIRGQ